MWKINTYPCEANMRRYIAQKQKLTSYLCVESLYLIVELFVKYINKNKIPLSRWRQRRDMLRISVMLNTYIHLHMYKIACGESNIFIQKTVHVCERDNVQHILRRIQVYWKLIYFIFRLIIFK